MVVGPSGAVEMKKQIWLQPQQVDLVAASHKYVRARCTEADSFQTAISTLAKGYTIRRIDEVLALLEPQEKA